MKSLVFKIACIAVMAAALSGCILYVSPDHQIHHTITTDEHPAAVDEHPAPST